MIFCYFVDVDECEADISDCDVNAKCINTEGSHNCTCQSGFAGNGTSCEGACLEVVDIPNASHTVPCAVGGYF